jgi:hypothetical protein
MTMLSVRALHSFSNALQKPRSGGVGLHSLSILFLLAKVCQEVHPV